MRHLTLAVALMLGSSATAQSLFDGGAPALPITKVDAHPRLTPLQNTLTAGDANSWTTNIYLIEQLLLGDGGFPAYSQLAGWQTVLDCDFTQQPYLPMDGGNVSYTICGALWTVINSANASWPPEVDAGLNLIPNGSAVGGPPDTSVGVTIPLVSLYPTASVTTSWRITWYESDNLSTDFQFCHLSVSDLTQQSGSSPTWTLVSHSHRSSIGWGTQITVKGGGGAQDQNVTTAPFNASHVVQLDMPQGFMNSSYTSWAQVDGGYIWNQQTAYPLTAGAPLASGGATTNGTAPLANWGIAITAAQNSGSGFLQCQTKRITVEVHP